MASSFAEQTGHLLRKTCGIKSIEGKLSSSKYAKMAKCSQDTASRDLQDLVLKKVLEKDPIMGRNTNYLLLQPS